MGEKNTQNNCCYIEVSTTPAVTACPDLLYLAAICSLWAWSSVKKCVEVTQSQRLSFSLLQINVILQTFWELISSLQPECRVIVLTENIS